MNDLYMHSEHHVAITTRQGGTLAVPQGARGVVLFAHGSGSSRYSPRNRAVARVLQGSGFATLLFDLLTEEEEAKERYSGVLRFDIDLLSDRLVLATDWVRRRAETAALAIGYFGASTGAAAALVAAVQRPHEAHAVVSRGGRPDLAGAEILKDVRAPTLLIVGGNDAPVIDLNWKAYELLVGCKKRFVVIPGATHLFEEPGALEQVAELAAGWFAKHFPQAFVNRPGKSAGAESTPMHRR